MIARTFRDAKHCPTGCDDYVLVVQLPLFGRQMHLEQRRLEHGGDVRKGQRKLERPVSTRRPMHVVLTSHRAEGPWAMRRHDRAIRDAMRAMARRFDVRIYDYANVGMHLHLVVRARRREGFQGFLRSFPGIVARRITGARRGRPAGPFFSRLAWTRIVSWGRDYAGLRHYVFRNQIEEEEGTLVRRAMELGPTTRRSTRRPSTPRAPPRP
jgi:hypothetical protein